MAPRRTATAEVKPPAAAPAEEAGPAQESSASCSPSQQDSGADDTVWFLPNNWEVYWCPEDHCIAFYEVWEGDKRFECDLSEIAVKAKLGAGPLEARPLDLQRLTAAGEIAGKSVLLDPVEDPNADGGPSDWGAAVDQAAQAEALQESIAPAGEAPTFTLAAHESTLGCGQLHSQAATELKEAVPYTVLSIRLMKFKRRAGFFGWEHWAEPVSHIQLLGWDSSRDWRECHLEGKGKAYIGRTELPALQPAGRKDIWLPINPLFLAAVEGDVPLLREWLASGGHANAQDERQRTPLSYAAEFDQADCCVCLFNAGARDAAAVQKASDPRLKALLTALGGLDDSQVDRKMLDEQVAALRPEVRRLAEAMLDAVAANKQQKRYRGQYNTLMQQLQAEDEEDRILRHLQEDRRRRQQRLAAEEALAKAEAEARMLQEQQRKAEEAKRKAEEEETAAVIARLKQAQLLFEQEQREKELREEVLEQRREEKRKLFNQKILALEDSHALEENEAQRLKEERRERQLEREKRARARQAALEEEAAQEMLRQQQLKELEVLYKEQKAEAWTCMECGEDSVDHPQCPGSCMFCGTPRHQGHIAKTWEGWTWGPGGAMLRQG